MGSNLDGDRRLVMQQVGQGEYCKGTARTSSIFAMRLDTPAVIMSRWMMRYI